MCRWEMLAANLSEALEDLEQLPSEVRTNLRGGLPVGVPGVYPVGNEAGGWVWQGATVDNIDELLGNRAPSAIAALPDLHQSLSMASMAWSP